MEVWALIGIEMTCILAACAFFIFLYFINKLLRTRRTSQEILPFLGLAIIFIFHGQGWCCS
ncbi:MAG: hypothetical protein ACTSYB_05625 [Candidatus Helarchaeota archaeon]